MFEWKVSIPLHRPFFILFLIVGLFPLLYTMWIATRQFNTLTGDAGFAVCGSTLRHHECFLVRQLHVGAASADLLRGIAQPVAIFLLSSIPQIIIALWLAWVLDANLKAKTFWRMGVLHCRTSSRLPLRASIFRRFSPTKWVPSMYCYSKIGAQPIDRTRQHYSGRIAIATIVNWRYIGLQHADFACRYAGHSPRQLEVAVVDGAGKWRTFRSVTCRCFGHV